jgi:hypothetical protein
LREQGVGHVEMLILVLDGAAIALLIYEAQEVGGVLALLLNLLLHLMMHGAVDGGLANGVAGDVF